MKQVKRTKSLRRVFFAAMAAVLFTGIALTSIAHNKTSAAVQNGKVIVASSTKLYSFNADASGEQALLNIPANTYLGSGYNIDSITSDGKTVLFLDAANHEVYTTNIFGQNKQSIVAAATVGNARISKDGRYVVYEVNPSTNPVANGGLYRFDRWTNTTTTIVSQPNEIYNMSALSDDGSLVGAFVINTTAPTNHAAVKAYNTDGTGATGFAFAGSNTLGDDILAFSHDNSKVLYSSYGYATDAAQTGYSLYTSGVDGSGPFVVYSNTIGLCTPGGCSVTKSVFPGTFSPDNSEIFASTAGSATGGPSSPNAETFSVNADGTAFTTRQSGDNYADRSFSFSPDGTQVVGSFRTTANTTFRAQALNVHNGSVITYQPSGVTTDVGAVGWIPNGPTLADDNSQGITSTVAAGEDFNDIDWAVDNLETLTNDGQLGNVDVLTGGTLKGHGTFKGVSVDNGGTIAPGNSPGCMTVLNLNLNGGSTLDEEIGGTSPCGQYDAINASGTVTIDTAAVLNPIAYNNFAASAGNSFTIINNTGSSPISGTFSGLAEGARFTLNGVEYQISYTGGDGNDVVLTVPATTAAGQPNGSGAAVAAAAAPGTPNTGMSMVAAHPAISLAVSVLAASTLVFTARRLKSQS